MIGSPVTHSLSPVLHRAAYEHLGLDWRYDAVTVEPSGLGAFLDGLDASWRGLSVTMPLKEAVVAAATELAETVRPVGVANTLVLEGGSRVAHNTDIAGIRSALAEVGVERTGTATILGGGSTALAAMAACAGVSDRVTVCMRRVERAGRLRAVASALDVEVSVVEWSETAGLLGAPLVLSTTPPGAADVWSASVPATPGVLLDVVYRPWPTVLASAWRRRGGQVLSGVDLLVHQAVGQVALMTGRTVGVEVLREAAERVSAR